MKIDLKDFFHSIDKSKIFYLFKGIGYNNLVSNILTNLCTYEERVPQGAITSPVISNLVCKKLDYRLSGVASKRGISYTRYADDMYFSCDDEVLLRKTQNMIYEIIKDEGFVVNNKKIKFMGPHSKKFITGLIINEVKVLVPREMKRKVRVMIHQAIATGDYSNIDTIKGYISFISSIEKDYKIKIEKYCEKLIEKEQYRIFNDIVEKYNKNNFLKTKSMEYMQDEQVDDVFGDVTYLSELYLDERVQFYKRNNIDNKIDEFFNSNKEVTTDFNIENEEFVN